MALYKVFTEPKKAVFYGYFYGRSLFPRTRARRAILCRPSVPYRPYLYWKIARLLGLTLTDSERDCALGLYFHDSDVDAMSPELFPKGLKVLNAGCSNIRKDRVDRIFGEVAGYSIEVEPTTHVGPIVSKSVVNCAHDGVILQAPLPNRENDRVYQIVVDNRIDDEMIEDLRVVVVGREIAYVLRKRRPIAVRFDNVTASATVHAATEAFSPDEVTLILKFAERFGVDIAELDVLRNSGDGRIYVVDVNTTPHSPPDVLIIQPGIDCMRLIAAAFERQFLQAL